MAHRLAAPASWAVQADRLEREERQRPFAAAPRTVHPRARRTLHRTPRMDQSISWPYSSVVPPSRASANLARMDGKASLSAVDGSIGALGTRSAIFGLFGQSGWVAELLDVRCSNLTRLGWAIGREPTCPT